MSKLICAIFLFAFTLTPPAPEPAEVIYYNGKIVTLWGAHPIAQAVAIRGERFLKVGANAEVLKTAGPHTKKIDLHGRTVLPGLIDSHTHPITAALSERNGPLPAFNSIADIQAYIRQRAAGLPKDQVILVPKVFAPRLKERRYPTRYELDAAAAERAVLADNGYAGVANSLLLAKLNLTRDTPQPANGKIIKNDQGEPTGLILGAPQLLREYRRDETVTQAEMIEALQRMQHAYNRVGITSTIDRGQGPEGFRAYQELQRRGAMTVRSYVTYRISGQGTPRQAREEIQRLPFVTGWGDDWLRVGSLKIVMDGGILIGTAYLREPYGEHTDVYGYHDAEYRGVLAVPRENVAEIARAANELGWQMTAHVTGGGSLDVLLDAYEAADREHSIRERRFTVTHGNFPNEQAIARAKKLGVVFDCQPAWHHLDAPMLKGVLGPQRMAHFLPLRSLFDAGVIVAGGSDHMTRFDPRQSTNPYHPFFGMWMAITRQTVDGSVINPEQRITREQALRMWTLNGAYLSFEEKSKGSIEPGKLADLIVVSKDFLSCPVDEIKSIETLLTVVDGKEVYRATKPIPPKTVVLTFDDAVKTHLTVVAPLLKQLGFRATFFITQKWMEDQAYFLTWDEVARIHRMGFEIGNHSWTHSNFGQAENGEKLGAELELVEKELAKVGVPKPVSFAWCGNAFGPEALEQLRRRGYVVARRGMQPDVPYGAIQVGPALQVKKHHPLLIPTTGDAYPAWTFEHFRKVLLSAKPDEIIVLQFHGVPDEKHPWVNTPPAAFREYMTYLKQNGYRTLALRDLLQYYDSAHLPDDPLLKTRCCAK